MINQNEIEFVVCDLENPLHQEKFYSFLLEYMNDKMGGKITPDALHKHNVINNFPKNDSTFILFILHKKIYVGMSVCFINFSTFQAKPYFNVHDVIIKSDYRGKGFGKALMKKIIDTAKERDYCKVTLEVREDNTNAQSLYKSLGFKDTTPPMWFWTKQL